MEMGTVGLGLPGMGRFSEPTLLLLISLAEGEKHGYAMMEDIRKTYGVELGPGTLYGALARLEQGGLIEPLPSEDRRRPYRLTPAGSRALREHLLNLQHVAASGLQRLATP
jgi:DNA-binding PadR family transcriptional regulator